MLEILGLHRDIGSTITAVIILLIVFIGIPQAFKETNSWWFIIIKFWLFLFPAFFTVFGVLAFFIGPITAILGIFLEEYLWVTLLYIYTIAILILSDFINKKYNNWLDKL